jgi:hypothetical protein
MDNPREQPPMSDAFCFACFACHKAFMQSSSSRGDMPTAQRPRTCPECNKSIVYLLRCVTVAEAEAENMVRDYRLGPDPITFGWANKQWREFLARMHPGDELWEYRTPQEDWDQLMGSSGFVLIRDGQIIASHVDRMN